MVDDGSGQLKIESRTVSAEGRDDLDSTQGIPFVNTYDPAAASYEISGVKTILNTDPGTDRVPVNGEFSFTLTGLDGAPMPEGAQDGTLTVENEGGAFTFGSISYTRPGVYRYTVSEVRGDDPSIDYSEAVHEVTVTVVDTKGALTATADKTPAQIAFENAYTPASTQATVAGVKYLTGRDLNEGEFAFILCDSEGAELQRVTNGADGSFAFEPIAFAKVGTYRFSVSEVEGDLGGVTYDDRIYTVTVEVTEDAASHQLVAKTSVSLEDDVVDGIVFKNAYAPAPTSIAFRAAKTLEGRDLQKGEFSFELLEGDEVLQTVKNGKPGADGFAPVEFESIEYTEPGEHDYSIREVVGTAEGMTYDETVFTYHVSVIDDGMGALQVEWTEGEMGEPVFRNSYKEPSKPVKPVDPSKPADPGTGGDLPQTGDASLLYAYGAGLAGTALVALGAWSAMHRKRR